MAMVAIEVNDVPSIVAVSVLELPLGSFGLEPPHAVIVMIAARHTVRRTPDIVTRVDEIMGG